MASFTRPEAISLTKKAELCDHLQGNNGGPDEQHLEPFEADKVLSALEDWSEVLRADPEISRKLAAFSEAAEDTSVRSTDVLPPPPEPSP